MTIPRTLRPALLREETEPDRKSSKLSGNVAKRTYQTKPRIIFNQVLTVVAIRF
jgi:hypothetical protein